MKNRLVMGIGNVLMGDDAFGPYVTQVLGARYALPEDVEVEEIGTPGLDLMMHLSGRRSIVVVDTVRADGSPGELRRYDRDALLTIPPTQVMTPHDPGLREALLTLAMTDELAPDVTLIGVIPEHVDTPVGLTPAVQAAVPAAIDAVLAELRRVGVTLEERAEPLPLEIWWE